MAQQRRPQRKNKPDRILHPNASNAEIQCDYAMAPFEGEAKSMNAKWGINRLPELVSVEMAARYGIAIAHLHDCINARDPATTAAAAANCIKGLNAMDAEATAAGAKSVAGQYWECEMGDDPDDFKFAVMAQGADWRVLREDRPDLVFFTLREVGFALNTKMATPMVMANKEAFPGATITNLKPDPPVDYAAGGDPLTF